MGGAWEDIAEGGGGAIHLGEVLLRINTSGDVVWRIDVGVVGANGAEAGGSSCGIPETVNKVKVKEAEGSIRGGRWQQKNKIQEAGRQTLQTYFERRQAVVVEWVDLQSVGTRAFMK